MWWQAAGSRPKKLFIGLGVGTALIIVAGLVWWIPQRQLAPLKAEIQRERGSLKPEERLRLEHDARRLENDARTTLVQAFGGLALLIGIYWSARTWQTMREGQITDRFTNAINQLGETGREKLAIRLGGIYALERIARDSERDHWPIMEVLTAYVRENAPWKEEEQRSTEETSPHEPQPTQSNQSPPKLAIDIQAILTVLGRRTRTFDEGEDQRLDLSRTALRRALLGRAHLVRASLRAAHLEGALLGRAHLEWADLVEAHLVRASLRAAHLEGASLTEAQLEGADLWAAQLEGANLTGAQLERANLRGAHLERANLRIAQLQGADLQGAQLEGARNLMVEQLSTVNTLYQAHLDPPLLERIQQQYPQLLKGP
jgi:uncharacterized protein YjbI with pentapeptide repeats